jgi:lysophospholipase L1-like esterase
MNRIIRSLIFCLLFFVNLHSLHAQPFAQDVAEFRKQDSISFPAKNAILFIGSSSFTMWTDVNDYFPGYTIVNRGFGGSSLTDLIFYADDIIFPYKPRQIVIYCGENDLAASDTVSAEMVFERFKTLYQKVRKKLPFISIVYVSMKPSPSRQHLAEEIKYGNQLIKQYLTPRKQSKYVDVHKLMLGSDGEPMPDIFLEDNLHMNAKGYSIWQKALKPHLLKTKK